MKKKLNEIKKDFEQKYKINVIVIRLDLSVDNDVDYLYEYVEKNKIVVDNLINNAGIGNFGEFYKADCTKDLDMIKLNVYSLTKLMKLFLPNMIKRNKGGILNVASTAAFGVGPMMSVYYATKSYVLSLTESVSAEVKGTNVKIEAMFQDLLILDSKEKQELRKLRLLRGI